MSDEQPFIPPAFPETVTLGPSGTIYYGTPGMSLRDYFAVHCPPQYTDVEGWSGRELATLLGKKEYNWREDYRSVIAVLQYEYADSMMKAREK